MQQQQENKYNSSDITLEINITIGKDFKKTLIYIQGQDPVLAASLFCEQNNLKPSAVYYIQQAIEQVIDNVQEIENNNQNNNHEQSLIPESNSYDEYDDGMSSQSEDQLQYNRNYNPISPLSQKQQNYKQQQQQQYSKSPMRSSNQSNSNQKYYQHYKNDLSDSGKKAYQINKNHRSDILLNPGIRLYEKGQVQNQIKEKRLEQMKIYQEQQYLKEATFQPTINFNSLLMSEKQDQQERKDKMKRKKEDRMNQIKQNSLVKEQEKCTFQPQIGIVSSRIGQFTKEHREVQEVFQHLYLDSYRRHEQSEKKKVELSHLLEEKNKLECTFTPEKYTHYKPQQEGSSSNRKQQNQQHQQLQYINKKESEYLDKNELEQFLRNKQEQIERNISDFNHSNSIIQQNINNNSHDDNSSKLSQNYQQESIHINQQDFTQQLKLTLHKIQDNHDHIHNNVNNINNNNNVNSSYNSIQSLSDISLLSARDGLIINRPKMKTPLCNYDTFEQIHPVQYQSQQNNRLSIHQMNHDALKDNNQNNIQTQIKDKNNNDNRKSINNNTINPNINNNNQNNVNNNNKINQSNVNNNSNNQKNIQNQNISQQQPIQKNFFNLENKFQQMKSNQQQQMQNITSPTKQQYIKQQQHQNQNKSPSKKLTRSNSLNVWDNLYKQAVQQKENQKEFEYKIKQQIYQEINKQKLSLKSKEIINQQRDQIIECIFEVLDGKNLGYISPDNLNQHHLSQNLNKILKPLYDAVLLNNTILDCVQFKKAVKTLYNTIDFNDKLVISRILQNRSNSLPNRIKQHQIKSPYKLKRNNEANYICKRCKTCQDTLEIIDELDKIKLNYESVHGCIHHNQY